ncbi:mechanosensitive ion channel family protein [Candidatus Woesearchaeota archaeon]|nr:mechanosensitive ion channel family protein [Candidatus Woesearchaeota archaeon]
MIFGLTYEQIVGLAFFRPILALFIILCTFIVAKIVSAVLRRYMNKSAKYIKVDKTHFAFMRHFVSGAIYLVGFGIAVYTIPSFQKLAISLLAGAGIFAVVIGFASQAAFANIVSGIFIAIFKPFRVGDTIQVGTNLGIVEDITLRHTVIKNFENKRIVVPNTIISEEVIENRNLVDEKICKHIVVGISYNSDLEKAMKLLQQLAQKHPLCIDYRTPADKKNKKPKVSVKVIGLGDSSVDLKAWVWTKNASDAFELGCDIYRDIKLLYDKEGIEIPFPHRTVYVRKDKPKRKSRR